MLRNYAYSLNFQVKTSTMKFLITNALQTLCSSVVRRPILRSNV